MCWMFHVWYAHCSVFPPAGTFAVATKRKSGGTLMNDRASVPRRQCNSDIPIKVFTSIKFTILISYQHTTFLSHSRRWRVPFDVAQKNCPQYSPPTWKALNGKKEIQHVFNLYFSLHVHSGQFHWKLIRYINSRIQIQRSRKKCKKIPITEMRTLDPASSREQ